MKGRTIKVFLADGVPDGLRTAEIMNWTGKMVVFPRSQLPDFIKRPEANRTGIYILVGDDPNDPTKEQIYIGESDDVAVRLSQHAKDTNKDFWSRTVAVVSKDENLSKAHARYLENRLIALAGQTKRAVMINGNQGAPVTLSESDIADMEFFLSQIQVLLPVLGFPFTQPLPSVLQPATTTGVPAPAQPNTSPPLVLTVGKYSASAIEANGAFVVQAGSYLKAKAQPGIGNTYAQKRTSLLQAGTVIPASDPDYWTLTTNVQFDSPSAAAAVIQGYNINGRTAWQVDGTQQTYKEWQEAQLAAAGTVQAAPSASASIASASAASTNGSQT